MKADPRGVVFNLCRAVREGEKQLEDFLSDEIVKHLERLDWIEEDAVCINIVNGNWRVVALTGTGEAVSLWDAIDAARNPSPTPETPDE